jgi:hypothetical protein
MIPSVLMLALYLGAAPPAPADLAATAKLSLDGFGPVRGGMTEKEAAKALGRELVLDGEPGDCHWVTIKGVTGVDFMVEDGLITRVDLSEPQWSTDRGLHFGDSEEQARTIYGADLAKWGEPDEAIHRFMVQSKTKKEALFLEVEDKAITTLRAGRQPSVEYYEGCE